MKITIVSTIIATTIYISQGWEHDEYKLEVTQRKPISQQQETWFECLCKYYLVNNWMAMFCQLNPFQINNFKTERDPNWFSRQSTANALK